VPGLFVAGFPPGAEAQAVQSVLSGIHAAQTAGPASTSLLHANQLLEQISRRELLSVGLKTAAALLATGVGVVGFLAVRQPAVPRWPAFRPSGPQVVTLGQAWAQVQRQVAALRVNQSPGRGIGNTAATAIVKETVRISAELDALLTPATERAVLAEFLTVELRETLHLSERQQAYVFNLIRERLTGSDSLLTAMKVTLAAKAIVAEDIRLAFPAGSAGRRTEGQIWVRSGVRSKLLLLSFASNKRRNVKSCAPTPIRPQVLFCFAARLL